MDATISVIKLYDVLVVTMPADPNDRLVSQLQERVLAAMYRYEAKGLILDISAVETFDSFFARTVTETARMVTLMGGETVMVGMRPSVALTATQLGLRMGNVQAALDVNRALELLGIRSQREPAP